MTNLEFPDPLPAQKPAPKGKTDSAPKPSTSLPRQTPLKARLHETISSLGVMIALVNEVDGLAILDGAERLAESLDKAAKQSPRVKRSLEAALTGGVWAEVAFASSAIIFPIALNHGIVPAGLSGFLSTPKASANGNEPTPGN